MTGTDFNGNRLTRVYPGSVTATYAYDYADREPSLSILETGQTAITLVSAAGYLPSGPNLSLTLGNTLTETRGFNRRYAPTSIAATKAAVTIWSWGYTVDKVGNVTQIQRTVPTPTETRLFGYQDRQYFLASGSGPWSGPLGWSYDRIGNRLTETRGALTDSSSYLPNSAATGNRATLDLVALGVGGTRDYSFGPAGHLEDLAAGANTLDFASDDTGQLRTVYRTAADESIVSSYDGRGFLRRAEEWIAGAPTGAYVQSSYDSSGLEGGRLLRQSADG